MELYQLRHFVTVVEVGSVSKAASIVHVTQPALSRQMRSLERELGKSLFTRTAYGVEPTACGIRLHQHAQIIFDQVDRIPEILRAADQGMQLLRVGVPQGIPQEWGTAVLAALAERDDRIRLSFHEATTEEQRQLLQNGLIDLGLIHMEPPELSCELLLRQRMGIAVVHGSPLASKGSVQLSDLNGRRVMAHAIGEVNVEVNRLQAASAAVHASTEWLFRRFSEHTRLIAIASQVDAVLMTEASATRHLPEWTWIPLEDRDVTGHDLDIRTWAAWRHPAPPHLIRTVEVMVAVAHDFSWAATDAAVDL